MENIHENQHGAPEEFRIDSEERATWYLRKLANLEAEQSRIKKQAEIALKSLQSETESLKGRFHSELEQWARTEAERRKKRTLHTLQGTLRFRSLPSRLTIEDPAAAMVACLSEEWEGCIETRQALIASEYLKRAQERLSETGELVAGVGIVPERESFSISFGKEERE